MNVQLKKDTMKKLVLMLGLMTAMIAVQAQGNPPERPARPKERPENLQRPEGPGMREHQRLMEADVKLTPEQEAQVKKQHEDFRKQMEDLKKQNQLTGAEFKNKMQALHKEQRSKMENILTAEQKAKIEKKRKDEIAIRDIDRKAKLDKMKIQLGLTDEQAAKLKKQQDETAAKLNALQDNKDLDPQERKEQAKGLMKKQKEQLESVLTVEQLKKLKDMKDHDGMRGQKREAGFRGQRGPRGPHAPGAPQGPEGKGGPQGQRGPGGQRGHAAPAGHGGNEEAPEHPHTEI